MLFQPSNTEHYQISISTKYDVHQLQQEWLAIESQTRPSFFLSWTWISTWLNTYAPNLIIIKACLDNKVIAIGLLTSSVEHRHFVINAKQLRLNQIGNHAQDQIWVEYNDFICLPEHKTNAVTACLKYCLNSKIFKSHDEIIISMMLKSRADALTKSIQNCDILFSRHCYTSNLTNIKTPYLQSLKSNTRYQIRRSMRHYESSHGELTLTHSKSLKEALLFFNEAGPLHIDRWYDSGYKNPQFIKFHEHLITTFFPQNNIHLIKVKAGDTTIAILYYLIDKDRVSFYLQGLLYEQDKMLKPGLVAHTLATQYFMDQGMATYDYMGGYSQYKKQLASRVEDLVTIRIQKPIFKFILENSAQTLKNIFSRDHQ